MAQVKQKNKVKKIEEGRVKRIYTAASIAVGSLIYGGRAYAFVDQIGDLNDLSAAVGGLCVFLGGWKVLANIAKISNAADDGGLEGPEQKKALWGIGGGFLLGAAGAGFAVLTI